MCLAGVFQRLGRLARWKESLLHLAVWARLALHELEKDSAAEMSQAVGDPSHKIDN